MAHRSSRRRVQDNDNVEEADEHDVKAEEDPEMEQGDNDDDNDGDEDQHVASRCQKPNKHRKRSRRIAEPEDEASRNNDDEGDEEEEEEDDGPSCMFHSQAPEMSQDIVEVKASERNNLMGLSESQREKAIGNLTRLVLFKALAGESIDRAKACKDAGISDARISSAAFDEVKIRLQNCFAFELKRTVAVWLPRGKDSG